MGNARANMNSPIIVLPLGMFLEARHFHRSCIHHGGFGAEISTTSIMIATIPVSSFFFDFPSTASSGQTIGFITHLRLGVFFSKLVGKSGVLRTPGSRVKSTELFFLSGEQLGIGN
jgi:hypothetical protein